MSRTTEPVLRSFAEQATAFATAQGLPPFEAPPLDGTALRAREQLVRWHGPADAGESVYPGRTVIEVPGWTWAAERPEDCPDVSFTRSWYDREGYRLPNLLGRNTRRALVLLCELCGLDCT